MTSSWKQQTDGRLHSLRQKQNLQMTFSNTFSTMKMFELCFRFYRHLFLRVNMKINHYWFRWWLGTNQVPSNYLSQWWPSSMTIICCLLWRAMIASGFNVWKTVSLKHLKINFLKQNWKQHFLMQLPSHFDRMMCKFKIFDSDTFPLTFEAWRKVQ